MIKCKICGAECQNILDRYGETFVNRWLPIHGNPPHELEVDKENHNDVLRLQCEVLAGYEYFKLYHDKQGRRIV